MKFFSWNVNGFRAVSKKPEWQWFSQCDADVIGLQETKAMPEQIADAERNPDGYESYWLGATVKKGYSGVAAFTRTKPLSVVYDLPDERYQGEGRTVMLEFDKFFYFNIYFPNGQSGEERLQYKLGFYDAFLQHAEELRRNKPIVVCGDFNTAHHPIDLARPKENEGTSGFLPVERAWMDKFVAHGYVDTFRLKYPDAASMYSWWSYRFKARERNVGWRIDYFFVSEELRGAVKDASIEMEVFGSDHCPVGLELDI
ncbi:exodeoxyribonuclease III [Oleidesulfovibrio sp.]|uniref:exodeoxyribonuclease III n=1 Tax=Oleidesulfovibrio sp. TaxID=2909707 RepID=UPI003A857BB1